MEKWNRIHADRGWRDGVGWSWKKENLAVPKNGTLEMKFRREWKSENGGVYSAPHINTDCKFEQTYGFFEAKIKHVFPDGKQSAFWMMPNKGLLGKSN